MYLTCNPFFNPPSFSEQVGNCDILFRFGFLHRFGFILDTAEECPNVFRVKFLVFALPFIRDGLNRFRFGQLFGIRFNHGHPVFG